jgi:hypothetical protein
MISSEMPSLKYSLAAGSAHDSRVFRRCVTRRDARFSLPAFKERKCSEFLENALNS